MVQISSINSMKTCTRPEQASDACFFGGEEVGEAIVAEWEQGVVQHSASMGVVVIGLRKAESSVAFTFSFFQV